MGGETRFSSVRLLVHFCIFFLVSLVTTQQFNNHTISSMTIAVEKIATNTLDFY